MANERAQRSALTRCRSCQMHLGLCICSLLPRIATRTRLVLILHQLEANKPTNSGRIAIRCLPNSEIVLRGTRETAGALPASDSVFTPAWAKAAATPVLLYPYPDAKPIETWRDSFAPVTLIVPDGTWRQARRARRRVAGLEQIACAFLPFEEAPVPRRLRSSHRPERLATLEAIARALGILEGREVRSQLEEVFRIMVERTLWSRGHLRAADVTGGLPAGARVDDPVGRKQMRAKPL